MNKINNNLSIKTLELNDIPVMVQKFQEANWPKPATTFENYLEEQKNNERQVWLAFQDNQFAGYVTLKWKSQYEFFAENNIPEIMDLNILPNFRGQGIGSYLLDIAEKTALAKGDIVGIGVGLYGGMDGGYGNAQKLYVKRGYIPDGKGVTYNYKPATPGKSYLLDDELILWFTKRLKY